MGSIRPKEMSDYYRLNKWHNGSKCVACKSADAVEYHELIQRARTKGNAKLRELSFKKEICAFLCRECHEHARRHTEKILAFNVKLFGYQNVLEVLQSLGYVATYELSIVRKMEPTTFLREPNENVNKEGDSR